MIKRQSQGLKRSIFQSVIKDNSGFTLVELAVVLFIVGVMMGGGLTGWAHYVEKEKIRATDERFDTVLDALSVYVQNHKRLPCPADPDGDGTERAAGYCYDNSNILDSSTLYEEAEGVLPWRELGLPEDMVKDGWGRYITYRPAPHLTVMTESLQMQDMAGGSDGIHNACRNPVWYSDGAFGGSHLDRPKALFCCNAEPKSYYLTGDAGKASGDVPDNWEDQSVQATGQVGENSINVQSTHAWMDEAYDSSFSGDFAMPRHGTGDPDAPLIRATTHAVTLISHGGNGVFSFMRDTTDRQTQGVRSDDEEAVANNPEAVAGTAYHPKAGGYDPLGKRADASDDRVVFLRSDQLYARVGTATCVRPAFGKCVEGEGGGGNAAKNVSFIIDSSASMLEASRVRAPAKASFGLHPDAEVAVSRWQLATSAISEVSSILVDKKKENYNGGAGMAAEDVGAIGLNTFSGSGTSVQSYYQHEEGNEDNNKLLYTNMTSSVQWQITILQRQIDTLEQQITFYQTQVDAGNNVAYYEGRIQDTQNQITLKQTTIENLYEPYDSENIVDDPDAYLDNRVGQMEAFLSDYSVIPPLADNGAGRGTPLIESILETAKMKYELDPNSTQTIVMLTDGVDTDSAVPGDLVDVLSDTIQVPQTPNYYCGQPWMPWTDSRCQDTRSIDTATACNNRTSQNCYAVLYQYAGAVLATDYPNINLSVVDVAGNDVLNNFYAASGLKNLYTDVSSSADPQELVDALMEGAGLNSNCVTEEEETVETETLALEGDIYTRYTSSSSTENCDLDACGFSERTITSSTTTYYKGPRSYTESSRSTGTCGPSGTGCNCTCSYGGGGGGGGGAS